MVKSNGHITREQLVADINALVVDTDLLLKYMVEEGNAEAAELRAKVEQNLQIAKARLYELEQDVAKKTKVAAQTANTYVRTHPWQILGLTAGLGLLAGFLLRQR